MFFHDFSLHIEKALEQLVTTLLHSVAVAVICLSVDLM